MSECKTSNCAFYTCCYGKKKKKEVDGFGKEGRWVIPNFFDPVYLSMFIF